MPEKKNTAVPRLRFPEFRNAGPWEVERFGKVYRFKPTNSWPRDRLNYDVGTVKNIHYGDIHKGLSSAFRIADAILPFLNDELAANLSEDDFCEPGDIVFADASEDIVDIGKAIEIVDTSDQKLVSGLHTILASQIEPKIVTGFGAYLFASSGIRNQIRHRAQGAKVLGISKSQLSKIILAYPREEKEQQKIADCLSSLDDLIRAEAERLEALQAHKKGLMQQLFPREGETTPRLRFPEFRDAGPWEGRTIKDLAKKITQGGTPKTSVEKYWNGEIPWITPAEMGDDAACHYTERTLRAISFEGLQNSSAELLPVNSVIVSSRAPIGYVTINKVEMATNQGCKGIVPKEEVYHEFLYFSLLVANRRLNDLGAGAGFKEISASALKAFPIPVPELPEQQKIADCLSSLDDLIRAGAAWLEALQAHKKGLMQQLFPQEVS